MRAAAAAATSVAQHALPGGGGHIAYRLTQPPAAARAQPAPGAVIFIHGLCSSQAGTKAQALEADAAARGFAFLSFDQRGHGDSSGAFDTTHPGDWLADAETALVDLAPPGRHVLVGSSLGGWLALHLAQRHPERVAGLLLIAPALDFTRRLWASLGAERQAAATAEGRLRLDSKCVCVVCEARAQPAAHGPA